MLSKKMLLLVLLATLAALPVRSAEAQQRWAACVTLVTAKTFVAGPSVWTDGVGAVIGTAFQAGQILLGPGTLCSTTVLPQDPQDFHTTSSQINVSLGPGGEGGEVTTTFNLDLYFPAGVCPIYLPLYASSGASRTLDVSATYLEEDITDPSIRIAINETLAYKGLLSGFEPEDFGLYNAGYLDLVKQCISDVNGDFAVGFEDLVNILGFWGLCEDGLDACPGDSDGDQDVDFQDIIALINQWGDCRCP